MPRKITPVLTVALDEYLELRQTRMAKSTMTNDRALLRKFCREIGEIQVHQLTARTVELWAAKEAGRQKASSYNKELTRVRGFLGFCTGEVRWTPTHLARSVPGQSRGRSTCDCHPPGC